MSVKSKIQAVYDILSMQFVKNKPPYKVMSIEDTIKLVIDNHLSVSRYGDGEELMMANQMNESFQQYDKAFANKLKYILKHPIENHLVCIQDIWIDLDRYTENALKWHRYFLRRKKYLMYRYFDTDKVYGNSFITRCYMDFVDKTPCKGYFEMLKSIWRDRDIVIVEGEYSRLGVGNDLFIDAKSIERILCPAENAYRRYNDIIAEVRKFNQDRLILIALGATATVIAYDLANEGYQAIDIGHIDIEYEWMRMGARTKVPIPSKYVNEAGSAGRTNLSLEDEKYEKEIVARVL